MKFIIKHNYIENVRYLEYGYYYHMYGRTIRMLHFEAYNIRYENEFRIFCRKIKRLRFYIIDNIKIL